MIKRFTKRKLVAKTNTVGSQPSMLIYTSLVVVFCMVLVTLTEPIMGWVWVLSACAISIAYMRIKRNLPSVKNLTLNLLAIFCMALLIYLSGSFGLMDTMVNLLVVAACLKLINLHSRADFHLVLIVLFFLIACGFIYHQSIYIVVYYFACLVMLFITAFLLNRGKLSIPSSITQSGKMMLQSLPITIALFIVVPRLPPFWQTNVDTNTQTGLSEKITPGDIANLAQSDELVFRAEFDKQVPSPQQRYWRSIVLDYFDGKSWMIARQHIPYNPLPNVKKEILASQATIDYRYLIIAEPNNTRWLYSLDIPIIEDNMGKLPIAMNHQYQLYQSEINKSASLYILHSYIDAPLRSFVPKIDFAKYLQVPSEGNPRTQTWIDQNIDSSMSFTDKIASLNNFFLSQPFTYTLKPPLMLNQPVDNFLFDYQQGFCSHYASALTYMLRLSNIPARMVAGYQGGTLESDNILSIRQFDAHAWVEAFDENEGWVRLDPTALVAPNRTISGLLSALSALESRVFTGNINTFFNAPFFSELAKKMAVIDHNWDQFFLGFNNDSQGDLIEKLFGELSKKTLTTFLFIAIAGIAIFLAVLFLPYKKWLIRTPLSALTKVLLLLKKYGFEKRIEESLQQFYDRIEQNLTPLMQEALLAFVQAYYIKEYQANGNIDEQNLVVMYQALLAIKTPIASNLELN